MDAAAGTVTFRSQEEQKEAEQPQKNVNSAGVRLLIKKKPVSVKGLVFDMDGLLLDSEKSCKTVLGLCGKRTWI